MPAPAEAREPEGTPVPAAEMVGSPPTTRTTSTASAEGLPPRQAEHPSEPAAVTDADRAGTPDDRGGDRPDLGDGGGNPEAGGSPGDPDPADASAGGGSPQGRRPWDAGGALRLLSVPEHDDHFWTELTDRLVDEPQLRLRPRAAVRPITQPPPVIDDRIPFDDGDMGRLGGRRAAFSRRRRVVMYVVAVVLSLVLVASALQDSEGTDDVRTGDASSTTSEQPGATTAAPPPAPVDPSAPLAPAGVGPLIVEAPLGDLRAAGLAIAVDEPTFAGSGGACFDATVQGVDDLVLRFRSPQPGVGVEDAADGILASVAIDAQLGSQRTTEAGVGLGGPEQQVRDAYGDDLREAEHPYIPNGHVMTWESPDDDDVGLAFMTDGSVVTGIVAGDEDLIRYPEGCP